MVKLTSSDWCEIFYAVESKLERLSAATLDRSFNPEKTEMDRAAGAYQK